MKDRGTPPPPLRVPIPCSFGRVGPALGFLNSRPVAPSQRNVSSIGPTLRPQIILPAQPKKAQHRPDTALAKGIPACRTDT